MILKKSNNNAIQNKCITIKTWIDIEFYVYVFTCFACYEIFILVKTIIELHFQPLHENNVYYDMLSKKKCKFLICGYWFTISKT